MDGERECAFCGCVMFRARRVMCEDCRDEHEICQTCADDLPRDAEAYHLVA